ncbi:PREDICTED: programmed cell death protein 5 [Chaetura pelagica]|nr:PREDICTED: programmed cell death protein 5 [Chaetura pelagica]
MSRQGNLSSQGKSGYRQHFTNACALLLKLQHFTVKEQKGQAALQDKPPPNLLTAQGHRSAQEATLFRSCNRGAERSSRAPADTPRPHLPRRSRTRTTSSQPVATGPGPRQPELSCSCNDPTACLTSPQPSPFPPAEFLARLPGTSAQDPSGDPSQQEAKQREAEIRNTILAQVLDQAARARLSNLALVKPDKAKAVENYLIQMARFGQLPGKVSEQGLIEILEKVSQQTEKKTTVKFNRRKVLDSDEEDDY